MTSRKQQQIIDELARILEAASGIDVREYAPDQNFLDIGMDSLILTQASIQIERMFGVKLRFRDLLDSLGSVAALAAYLEPLTKLDIVDKATVAAPEATVSTPINLSSAPPPKADTAPNATPAATAVPPTAPAWQAPSATLTAQGTQLSALSTAPSRAVDQDSVAAMLQLFQVQLSILQQATLGIAAPTAPLRTPPTSAPAAPAASTPAAPTSIAPTTLTATPQANAPAPTPANDPEAKPFGAIARISKDAASMPPEQEKFFKSFIAKYQAKTIKSREHTQAYRSTHADPRVVTGFKPHLKELVYPLVMNRSKGAELWDIDGNRYVDLTCGFGSNFFGNMPNWLEDRLIQQIRCGVEIGPQHELAGKVSEKLTKYLGVDRVAFCNTGSEAILGAIRIARTVTGRDKIVTFSGSYHGIIDEVIVRANKTGKSMPAAPGIMGSAVGNTMVLEYGVPASLEAIKNNGHNIAAVLVESVQSRRPDFRPAEFLKALRALCDESGIVLIFDEIITGFRKGRYGAQGYYGINADLATYGKVIGGGISIGVIAGKRAFMDALDGGDWQYGDHSVPEVGVTYFAGTFVRHPLALAAIDAVLDFLNSSKPDLAEGLDHKADQYVARVNAMFERHHAPWRYVNWGSMMKLNPADDLPNLELLVYLLRYRGVHTWDGFPNFLTLAHSDEQIDFIINAFEETVREMAQAGFFPQTAKQVGRNIMSATTAEPILIGRGANGEPRHFVRDPKNPGLYIATSN
jgi:glutamate-1-semialdehyde aminotransferase/acyl carrier protein